MDKLIIMFIVISGRERERAILYFFHFYVVTVNDSRGRSYPHIDCQLTLKASVGFVPRVNTEGSFNFGMRVPQAKNTEVNYICI